jgi:hypothetical protein
MSGGTKTGQRKWGSVKGGKRRAELYPHMLSAWGAMGGRANSPKQQEVRKRNRVVNMTPDEHRLNGKATYLKLGRQHFSTMGLLGAHIRWHIKRGHCHPNCRLCRMANENA